MTLTLPPTTEVSAPWASGWTSLTALDLNDEGPYLLVYNRNSGIVRVDHLNPSGNGSTNVWQGTWAPGWTSIISFQPAGGARSILVYNSATGAVRIDTVNAGGVGTTNVWSGDWAKGWTHVEVAMCEVPGPPPPPGGISFGQSEPFLMVYNSGTGIVRIDSFVSSGKGTNNVWQSTWAPGWTTLLPFGAGDGGSFSDVLLAYNSNSGWVRMDNFNENGKATTNFWAPKEPHWATGWSAFQGFVDQGDGPCLLAYNDVSGLVHVGKAVATGGMENQWVSTWASGWSSFVFYGETSTGVGATEVDVFGLSYMVGSGEMQIMRYARSTVLIPT